MFTPNQIKTTIHPIIFTAQDVVYFRMQDSINFGTESSFQTILIQHSNYLAKLLVIPSFLLILQIILVHISQTNPFNFLRIGLHDKLLNLTPLFTPSWFADAFITFFGYPCYILTQCGTYFSRFLFLQATIKLLIKIYKTFSIKNNLQQNITIFSSIALGFFNRLTSEMINDLKDAASKKKSIGSEQNFFKIFSVNHYRKRIRPNVHYFRISL